MDARELLFKATATAEAGADLCAERDAGLVRLTPISPRAHLWLANNIAEDAIWHGEAVVIELRSFGPIADAAIAAGLLFERAPLAN
jgi:hypothetical protein